MNRKGFVYVFPMIVLGIVALSLIIKSIDNHQSTRQKTHENSINEHITND